MNYTEFPRWIVFLLPFILLDLILKAVAAYKAARNGEKIWYIAQLFVNSMGVLPAIYILFYSKKK